MSHRSRTLARLALTVAAVGAAAVVGIVASPGPDRVIAAVGGPLGSGGEFQQLQPDRIFDTREAELDVEPFGAKPLDPTQAGPTVDIPVLGKGGLPEPMDDNNDGVDDRVLAVVLNITVIEPTTEGWLRAFGTGAPEGTTSVVNFFPGQVVPNTAILRPGDDGMVSLRLFGASGTADVAVDVTGWFSTTQYMDTEGGDRGDRVVAIPPVRVYDSDFQQFGGLPIRGELRQVEVPVRGAAAVEVPGTPVIPDDENIVGVVANITGVNTYGASNGTYISALPAPVPPGQRPATSTVNLAVGQIRPNLAILPLDDDGSIHLFNLSGEVRMVVDVVAYLLDNTPEETRAGRVVPLISPFRAFDVREPDFGNQPLGPGEAEDWSFERFIDDVKIDGQPVGAQSALIANLTATGLERQYPAQPESTFLTGYPTPSSGQDVPFVSNVNITEGDTVPNLALLPFGARPEPEGDGRCEAAHCIRFYNKAGYLDYLLDVYAVILADD